MRILPFMKPKKGVTIAGVDYAPDSGGGGGGGGGGSVSFEMNDDTTLASVGLKYSPVYKMGDKQVYRLFYKDHSSSPFTTSSGPGFTITNYGIRVDEVFDADGVVFNSYEEKYKYCGNGDRAQFSVSVVKQGDGQRVKASFKSVESDTFWDILFHIDFTIKED